MSMEIIVNMVKIVAQNIWKLFYVTIVLKSIEVLKCCTKQPMVLLAETKTIDVLTEKCLELNSCYFSTSFHELYPRLFLKIL